MESDEVRIGYLEDQLEAVEDERNLYLRVLELLQIDPSTATKIARGDICHKCMKSVNDHGPNNKCPSEEVIEEAPKLSDPNANVNWMELYKQELIHTFGLTIAGSEGLTPVLIWSDLEKHYELKLAAMGMEQQDINTLRGKLLDELEVDYFGFDDDDDDEDDDYYADDDNDFDDDEAEEEALSALVVLDDKVSDTKDREPIPIYDWDNSDLIDIDEDIYEDDFEDDFEEDEMEDEDEFILQTEDTVSSSATDTLNKIPVEDDLY